MEQRNLFLAFILTISFLALWFGVVVPRFTPPPAPYVPERVAPPAHTAAVSSTLGAAHSPTQAAVDAASPDSFLRDTQNEVVVTSRGGGIRHWRLKVKNMEIDLARQAESDLPLTTFPDASFTVRQSDRGMTVTGLVAPGVYLTKSLTLDPAGHLHDLNLEFKNTTGQNATLGWELGWGPGLGTTPSEEKENGSLTRALSMGPTHALALKAGDYEAGSWVAIDNRYFMVALVPPAEAAAKLVVTGKAEQTKIALKHQTTVPAHGRATLRYKIYAGPKGYSQLKKYGLRLEEGVDFGMFSSIGRVILRSLNFFEQRTGNYGWAIVLLTVCLQLLLLPLTIKSFRAQLAMKKLQPKIAALQARYKSDPKRLNVEMMNLYKTTGTNPFGGCLPMLLQLPIFWALFTTLRNAYELRGAPFILWMHDLSAADALPGMPFVHVLPLLLGCAMFFQQRLAGAVTDPTQKQMMTIMPIMFTFMFYGFPSGLALYWLTSNLMTMSFQFTMMRLQANPGAGTPDSPEIIHR